MEVGLARLRAFTVTTTTFRRLAYAALALLFLIVVSGATVRLTASGLGCENWPRCGDTFLPAKDFHALVEFGNRVVGFVVGLVTLAAALAAWRAGVPRWLLLTAWALPVTVLLQGVLGGITVLVELHPLTVMAHFLLSLVALALAVVLVVGARGTNWRPQLSALAFPALALVPSALVLVVTGTLVTAAGPHSGGEDIRRFGNLVEMLHVHIGATAVFGVAFVSVIAWLLARRREARVELGLGLGVLGLLLVQMAIGELQWRTELPWGLVLVHVALGTAVFAGVVALAARLVLRPRPTT